MPLSGARGGGIVLWWFAFVPGRVGWEGLVVRCWGVYASQVWPL